MPDDKTDRPLQPRKTLPLVGFGVLIFLAGMVVAYLFLAEKPERPPPMPEAPTARPGAPAEEPGAPLAPTPTPAVAPAQEVADGMDARALIARIKEGTRPPDMEAIFVRAEEFRADGMLADAHLLYFFAAREGHAPSARVLGSLYDPNQQVADASIMDEPDAAQAYKWYAKAASGGDGEAEERLEELRVWVEREARAGDPDARRLLMQWQF